MTPGSVWTLDMLPGAVAARVMENEDTGCWEWVGSVKPNGYGAFWTKGDDRKRWNAHRLVYTLLVGGIPDGLELDHLCRVRHCVRPDHLEPVTHVENIRRSPFKGGLTHCAAAGHPLSGRNLYIAPRKNRAPTRECRACRAQAQRECTRRREARMTGLSSQAAA
jgi:hypothetical protein